MLSSSHLQTPPPVRSPRLIFLFISFFPFCQFFSDILLIPSVHSQLLNASCLLPAAVLARSLPASPPPPPAHSPPPVCSAPRAGGDQAPPSRHHPPPQIPHSSGQMPPHFPYSLCSETDAPESRAGRLPFGVDLHETQRPLVQSRVSVRGRSSLAAGRSGRRLSPRDTPQTAGH